MAEIRLLETEAGSVTTPASGKVSLFFDKSGNLNQKNSKGEVTFVAGPETVVLKGSYNASTNTPALVNGTGKIGTMYIVSVAGERNFGAGAMHLHVGDFIIYTGSVWERIGGAVTEVFGRTGAITSEANDYNISQIEGAGEAASANIGTAAGQVAPGNLTTNVFVNLYGKETKKSRNESFAINLWVGELGAGTPEHIAANDLLIIALE